MQKLNRRALIKSGVALGAAAATGTLVAAHAADAPTELTLYNAQHKNTATRLVEAFTEATGIKVIRRDGKSTQLANQIIEEGARSPADVFYAEESPPLAALAERGLLAPLPQPILDRIRVNYRDPDGTWTGVTARCRVTVYNKNMVDAAELPDSVLDMPTEKWQGRLAFVPTSGAFQQQIVAIKELRGRDVALQWLKDLKRYGEIYPSNMAAMQAVERGDIATALVNNYYWYIVAKEKGADNMQSALHYSRHQDPGALVTVSAVGVLKSARNTTAAQKLVDFMTSVEGQTLLSGSVAEWPMNPEVEPSFALKPFDELQPPAVNPANIGGAEDALQLRREAGLA